MLLCLFAVSIATAASPFRLPGAFSLASALAPAPALAARTAGTREGGRILDKMLSPLIHNPKVVKWTRRVYPARLMQQRVASELRYMLINSGVAIPTFMFGPQLPEPLNWAAFGIGLTGIGSNSLSYLVSLKSPHDPLEVTKADEAMRPHLSAVQRHVKLFVKHGGAYTPEIQRSDLGKTISDIYTWKELPAAAQTHLIDVHIAAIDEIRDDFGYKALDRQSIQTVKDTFSQLLAKLPQREVTPREFFERWQEEIAEWQQPEAGGGSL